MRAKVGFEVTAHTPQRNDKNRDFDRNKLDLTVTFSTEYDTGTLTSNTFKLEYRDQAGNWQPVAGSFTQLAPDKSRFVPNSNLKDGIRYRATVKSGPSGVKSKDGAELDRDTVWYFWTVPNLNVTDNFDYGGGSVCPPSAQPCPGLELAVFQVARNATMVPGGKDAAARLYLRWKPHTDVHPDDQVKEMEVDASITVGGATYKRRQTVKRPDRFSAAEIQAASNSVNIYHTPAAVFNYTAEVVPRPQTNASPVKYTQSRNLASSGRSPRITFDYYFLQDGAWAGGVPAAARTDGINTMTAGTQFITDQFPVLGTTFAQKGDYSIGYTFTGNNVNDPSCGVVQEVACPFWWFLSRNKAEIWCVFEKLETMRGGRKFVAATVPNTLCPGATAFAIANKVFMHQSGAGGNDGTVAHEVGHIYGISTANNPSRKHRNDSSGVEGFQVRTRTNRSRVENSANSVSLMHTTLQPQGTQWVHNDDYATLMGTVTARALQPATVNTTGSYLIVFGYVNTDTNTVDLAPAFLQEVPNDPPSATGPCTIALLDGSNNVLSSDYVTPSADVHVDVERVANETRPLNVSQAAGPRYFSVSLPWDDNAQSIRVSCDGTVLGTRERSANAPTVYLPLTDGSTLNGLQTLNWLSNDADGPGLAYQFQFSSDGAATWTPLAPLGLYTSYDLDTTLLPSGDDMQLRIMVTDGFDTAYDTVTVNIYNPLTVLGVIPADAAVNVDLNTTPQALFVTDVASPTLQGGGFELLEGWTRVPGTVSYNPASRMAIFAPDSPLQADTSYTARLEYVRDVAGYYLWTYEWSFTTISDTVPPLIVSTSPADAELEVPLNALVQAEFNEAMEAGTLGDSSFQLLGEDSTPVTGAVTYNATSLQALFTPSAVLAPNTTYTAHVTTGVADAAGNPMESTYEWSFTTGVITSPNGVRIVGNYNDRAFDVDGDGLYDNLTLYVDVEVLSASTQNLNARLVDKSDVLLEWQTTGRVYLTPGVHTLQLAFDSVPIRSNGVDGPYTLDTLNFYEIYHTTLVDLQYNAYQTFPYTVSEFYSVLALGGLPDLLLEWNTILDKAFNRRA